MRIGNVNLSRRDLFKLGTAGMLGAVGLHHLQSHGDPPAATNTNLREQAAQHAGHVLSGQLSCACPLSTVGMVPANELTPTQFLTHFDYGQVSALPDGRTLREYQIVAQEQEIEISADTKFQAWTYNGNVPGPTLRATEGDLVRVTFTNRGSHPHSIHFHGIHPAQMDGFEMVPVGGSVVYEFTAEPFGLHLYHCHVTPLREHIHRGLYGTFIVDPKTPRPPATEMVMVMNAFDTNGDQDNDLYAVNGIAFWFNDHPIEIKVGELVRIYLVNITEYDPINSLHLHANLFYYYPTGTSLTPRDYTDTVMLCQGERGIIEFSYKLPGRYMFHAHQSEFAEEGWMGFFDVTEPSHSTLE